MFRRSTNVLLPRPVACPENRYSAVKAAFLGGRLWAVSTTMTPLKDTLELGNQSNESAVSQGGVPPKQESGRLRADAVSLEVPVKVHGSRVTEVVRGITPHTEPFEEQSATIIVFPQGGVLKMSATLSAGQVVVITNLKSGQDAICRVAKVRPYGNAHSYVEIEFTQRQPGYWGVYFPSDGPEVAKKVAPPAASPVAPVPMPASAAPVAPAGPVQPLAEGSAPAQHTLAATPSNASATSSSVNPASAPLEHFVQPNLPESRFVSLGSQEDVQPAASATTGAKADPFAESERKNRAGEAPRKSAAIHLSATPAEVSSPSLSLAEMQGDTQAAPLKSSVAGVGENAEAASSVSAEPSTEKRSVTFGRFAAGTGPMGARPAPREAFGTRLDFGTAVAAQQTAKPGRNWFLIVVYVAALLAAIGGGIYYFYGRPAANRATSSIPAVPAPSVELNASQNSTSQPAISSSRAVPGPIAQLSPVNPAAAMASDPAITVRASEAAPAKPGKASPVAQSQPSAAVQQRNASAMPDVSGALNAHPVSSRPASAGQSEAAPALDAGTVSDNANGALPGIGASSVNLGVPTQPVLEAPLRVGGEVKPPRMISSVLPVYPSIARQAGQEGNVVIETVVDKTGNVASMKVVSGPPMLRQAALDALRQWKYEPSMLNGQPVSVQMIVTIQFHR